MDEPSDEALMARIAGGNEAAFRALAQRHSAPMLALARHILGNASDAEDVVQETMLRVWINAPRWRPIARLRTWLTRIVINLCIGHKRRARTVELEAAGEIADPAPDALEQHERSESDRALEQAIAKLPIRQRAAVVLSYREGLSNAETADILDTSVSAVETLLARAREKLRAELGDEDG